MSATRFFGFFSIVQEILGFYLFFFFFFNWRVGGRSVQEALNVLAKSCCNTKKMTKRNTIALFDTKREQETDHADYST